MLEMTERGQEMVTIEEAAKRFKKSPQTIRYWIRTKKIKGYKDELSGYVYVDANEIEAKSRLRPMDDDDGSGL